MAWVGFGFVGEKGERAKINVLQTFPPNPALLFFVVLLPSITLKCFKRFKPTVVATKHVQRNTWFAFFENLSEV